MMSRRIRQAGLTLIELMVAVTLLALVAVMTHRGLDSMLRANEITLEETERWRATMLFFERFGSDVLQPARRPVRDAAGNFLPVWWGRVLNDPEGGDAQFELSRKSETGRDDSRLGYRLRRETVELLVWPVLDRAPATSPATFALLDRVRAMRIRYMDARGAWQDRWPPSDGEPLPRAVAVELTLAEGLTMSRTFALP